MRLSSFPANNLLFCSLFFYNSFSKPYVPHNPNLKDGTVAINREANTSMQVHMFRMPAKSLLPSLGGNSSKTAF